MAISNIVELQAAVAEWMNRPQLAPKVPDWITLAESRIAKTLRVSRMIASASLPTVIDQRGVDLPAGWLEFKAVTVDGSPIDYMPADQLYARNASSPNTMYSIEGGQLLLGPIPGAVFNVDIRYYKRLDALENSSTNWLLQDHPDVYLYGALIEGALYVKNQNEAGQWGTLFDKAIAEVTSADRAAAISGSLLRIRSR